MTLGTKRELIQVIRKVYRKSSKAQKSSHLDHLELATGLKRNYLNRLLLQGYKAKRRKPGSKSPLHSYTLDFRASGRGIAFFPFPFFPFLFPCRGTTFLSVNHRRKPYACGRCVHHRSAPTTFFCELRPWNQLKICFHYIRIAQPYGHIFRPC